MPPPFYQSLYAATLHHGFTLSGDDTETYAYMAALTRLGGKSGNQALRENLGWDDTRYTAVKDQLTAQSRIVPGKGRGGSVALRK